MNGELINLKDSIFIFHKNKYTVYKFPYTYSEENEKEILSQEVRYSYLGCKENNKTGLFFESDIIKSQIVPVDSLLVLKAFFGFKYFDGGNDSLVETLRVKKKNITIEKYIPVKKYDDSYPDTTYLYFSDRFKNVNFSFSKPLDSLRKQKIFKVKMTSISQQSMTYSLKLPSREFDFELKDFDYDTKNAKLINHIFEQLKIRYQ